MPRDRILYPSNFKSKYTLDPVEMTKRNLDDVGASYEGLYRPVDDCYVIKITQDEDIPDHLLKLIRQRGFQTVGKKLFYYKRYSTIEVNAAQARPIYGDNPYVNQPVRPFPRFDNLDEF